MKFWKLVCLSIMMIFAVSCGGGGGSSKTGDASAGGAPTSSPTYYFLFPEINTQHTFSRTIVDNLGNTINQVIAEVIIAVNYQNGSFVFVRGDPTHNSITAGGTDYSIPTTTNYANNSDQNTSYTYINNGSTVTCTYNPHAEGPTYPLSVGNTWSSSWNFSCGNSVPINYTESGSIVGTESMTIPAGTFMTFKVQSTIAWTNASGTTFTDTRIIWRDVNGDHPIIKEEDSYTVSGTQLTNGYPVNMTAIFQN